MTSVFATGSVADAIPLIILDPAGFDRWQEDASAEDRGMADLQKFTGALGDRALLQDGGRLRAVLIGWGEAKRRARGRFPLAAHRAHLPEASYRIAETPEDFDTLQEVTGWCLAGYSFTRYAGRPANAALLHCPKGVDAARITAMVDGITLTQDLINTPANDLGPAGLEQAVADLAERHGAALRVIRGDDLLSQHFPMIHTVGRAAAEAPRLLDLTWGDATAPKVTLVGKGVCFDTGGLNLKPGASMGLMKKDMGGAANALGLAHMIMALGLPVRLRLLIPAVENAIGAGAFRPGDILQSRKGLTVEINNTDAEGRLVLADALALADEETPDLMLCMATLTGAARVALGPDVPPFFTDQEGLAQDLAQAATAQADPLWRLPFWDPYEPMIEPGIADLDNAPAGGMAGAITAALFLRRFVENARSFAHFDLYGWTPVAKPGRAKGGAAQGIRAMLAVIEEGRWHET
ncbi:leucyl aminopeptidase [Rubricella aquisinus]|uniref:Leucyl aminopeptidase n=1 Tax=Rubricella aquisinus TaxID=2028108 RepID=A0A840WIC6_9RHOB|nr:leucyl aminopeptidase family protein [Rubricella aquisinus]MBB5514241.1 leucyl aminopeptidase [Rubricella aquisinus]